MTVSRRLLVVSALVLAGGLNVTVAQGEGKPDIHALLMVTGSVTAKDGAGLVVFDLAALDRLEQVTFTTTTPWTKGSTSFQGVAGHAFIKAIGATGTILRARAKNDYAVEIPIEDFLTRGAIIATRVNGKPMSVREKGPLWVVYPYDSNPSLKSQTYQHRSIWQLERIHVV